MMLQCYSGSEAQPEEAMRRSMNALTEQPDEKRFIVNRTRTLLDADLMSAHQEAPGTAVNPAMNKFYDKQLAATVGHEAALEIALQSAQLAADLESFNAIRRAQGRPSLEEQDEIDRREIAALIAEFGPEGFDPDTVAWALGHEPPTDEELIAAGWSTGMEDIGRRPLPPSSAE